MLRQTLLACLLALLCFLSAFGVIYSKDLYLRLYEHERMLLVQAHNSKVEWSKLLLEQSALGAEPRVQEIAGQKLNMAMPQEKDIVIVQDHA